MIRPTKELLRDKRDGKALTPEELRAIASGIGDGTLSDAQVAAFAMAVFFRGLDATELPAFTLGMRDSGTVLTGRTSTSRCSTSTRPAAWETRCRSSSPR